MVTSDVLAPSVLSQFKSLIESNETFLVSSHIHPDGDAVGASLAFKRMLEVLGKRVIWVMDDDPGDMFSRFYSPEEISLFDPHHYDYTDCDVVVMVDASAWMRLGRVGIIMQEHPGKKLCIDHHQSLDHFPGVKVHDAESPSTTVIIYRLLKYLGLELTHKIAEPIYLGIIVDTQNFHLPNTTEETHRIAAACLKAGVSPSHVYEPVYGTMHFSRMRLMSAAFDTAQVHFDGKVGVMYTSQEMFKRCHASKMDDDGFSDLVRTIEGVSVGIYLREDPDKTIKVSWRAKGSNNVEVSARHFGGGGHIAAAGALFRERNMDEVIKIILHDMEERIKNGDII